MLFIKDLPSSQSQSDWMLNRRGWVLDYCKP